MILSQDRSALSDFNCRVKPAQSAQSALYIGTGQDLIFWLVSGESKPRYLPVLGFAAFTTRKCRALTLGKSGVNAG